MRSKIFSAVFFVVVFAVSPSAFAQQATTNVSLWPVKVYRVDKNLRLFVNTGETTSGYAVSSQSSGTDMVDFLGVDSGYNKVYIFTILPDDETTQPDPETPIIVLSDNSINADDTNVELVKNYRKSFSVKASDKLVIDNLYGKISVNTWNKNEIRVDVQVKVTAKDEADAKRLLNKVTIKNGQVNSVVSFKTNIAKEGVWNLLSGANKNVYRRIEINYIIYMPTRNALDISNQWGIIELPDFEGKVVINCSYTNLFAQSLSNTAEIHINNGDAKIAKLKMSDLNISYGNLNVGSADKLRAVVNFSSAKIGKINTSGVINMQYGTGLQIDDLDKNIQKLSVNSSFSNVKLGLNDTQNANINVTVRNGSISSTNPAINIAEKNTPDTTGNAQWKPEQNFKGQVGKGSTTKVITITSSYGSVKFD